MAALLSNAKTRTLVLIVVGVLVIGVVVAVSSSSDAPNATAVTERVSTTAEVPSSVRSTPGEQVSRRYQELQEQANIRGAQEAAERGETFIPTLVGSAEGYDDSGFEKQLSGMIDDLAIKCSQNEVDSLRAKGLNTSEIIIQLKCYGCSSEAINSLFNCNEITAALLTTGGCPGADITGCTKEAVEAMRAQNYSAEKVAQTMKKNGCAPGDIAKAMQEAGFSAADIAKSLKEAGFSPEEVAKAMKDAGFNANEIAQAMLDAGYSPSEIAQGLRAAGVDAAEIAAALKAAGVDAADIAAALASAGFDRSEILAALQKAGFTPLEIARAISSLDLEDADNAALLAQQQAESEEARRLAAQQEAARLAQFSQQRQNKIDELTQAMAGVRDEAIQVWTTIPEQSFVEGDWAALRLSPQDILAAGNGGTNATPGSAGRNGGANGEEDRPVILKAGNILFAVLDTAVNSDEPGPVLATVVSGSLKNSKLMGTMQVNIDGENIGINFSAINMPGEARSMGLSAVAIDPDTARTALATDVDHHYLLRWGSLFASSFVEGFASAVANSGTTQTTTQGAAGTTTTTTQPPLDSKQQLFAGIAAVGTKWSEVVARNFDRPITITIAQGTGIGVLINADLEFGTDPIYYTPPNATTTAQQQAAPAATPGQVTPEQAAELLGALQTAASGAPTQGATPAPAALGTPQTPALNINVGGRR